MPGRAEVREQRAEDRRQREEKKTSDTSHVSAASVFHTQRVWFAGNVIQTEHAATSLPTLVALKAISNGALAGASLPSRIKLLNWGRNESVKGPILVDEQSLAALNVNQARLGYDRIALDYEHNTVDGSPELSLRAPELESRQSYAEPRIVAVHSLRAPELESRQSSPPAAWFCLRPCF